MKIQTVVTQVADAVRGPVMAMGGLPDASANAEFDAVLSGGLIHAVYQPIIALGGGQTVGYEALARGPADSAFASPELLFRHAAQTGRLAELDRACGLAAFRGALAAGMPRRVPLFVNVEPTTLRTAPPQEVLEVHEAALAHLHIVVELTERSLSADPAALLAAILALRGRSIRIALDDVGADPTSLAMMPLLSPDVIKLDRSIVQGPVTPAVSAVVNAVLAESERTGAAVLAEGIETPHHLAIARSMGATLGQGWLFGRPGPLPDTFATADLVLAQVDAPTATADTPFAVARKHRPVIRTTKQMLKCLSRHLENKCLQLAESTVLMASFQHVRNFDGHARQRYRRLAAECVFTAVFAQGVPALPTAGIRGGPLQPDDPLINEWTVVVLGAHFAGGLFAFDRGGPGEHDDREFDFVLTYDRDVVIEAAQPLLHRLVPADPETYW
ncbi:sensor domain-containing phosphodiesterase [Catellatospora sichuanensis]|uniref:sensor domain-containing phosphodiesterase n=1 Tax=Catellatospora sichuanensis TaxID=1969805 RepID=UPI00118314AD|nr:EAL domain-containing protein [Catellatospora sichuanensis]